LKYALGNGLRKPAGSQALRASLTAAATPCTLPADQGIKGWGKQRHSTGAAPIGVPACGSGGRQPAPALNAQASPAPSRNAHLVQPPPAPAPGPASTTHTHSLPLLVPHSPARVPPPACSTSSKRLQPALT
jgi:hypothetical protein